MSTSTKQKAINYPDVVHALNTTDMRLDLDEAYKQLAASIIGLLERFDNVTKCLHSVDLLGLAPPFKPQWDVLRKSFKDLLWHFRSNVGFLSARTRMFYTTVLPLTARNSSGSRALDEKLHVLKSFMTISSDHSTLTRNLATAAMKFNNSLNSFHTSFSKFASQKLGTSQREIKHLCQKLADLDDCLRQLYLANGRFTGFDVTHFAFCIFRMSLSPRRNSNRGRYSHSKLALNNSDLIIIGRLYEQLDLTQNEIAHAHYTTQISHRKTDALTTAQMTMSTLVSDVMTVIESGLSPLLSIWSRLQSDCTELLRWLEDPRSQPSTPLVLVSLLDENMTLYATVADALDACTKGIDPSRFPRI